jgi:hypothetical protein
MKCLDCRSPAKEIAINVNLCVECTKCKTRRTILSYKSIRGG